MYFRSSWERKGGGGWRSEIFIFLEKKTDVNSNSYLHAKTKWLKDAQTPLFPLPLSSMYEQAVSHT